MQTRWKTVIFWGRKCHNLRWKLTLNVKLICSFCSQESFVCSAASSHPLSFIKCAKAPPHVIIICFYHHSHQHPRLQIIQQFLRLRIDKYCSERNSRDVRALFLARLQITANECFTIEISAKNINSSGKYLLHAMVWILHFGAGMCVTL